MKQFSDFGIDIPSHHGSGEVYTKCPQCSPTRKKPNVKCLSANIAESVWICHHCGWAGTLREGVKDRPELNLPRYKKPPPRNDQPPAQVTLDWFQKRGIDPDIVLEYGVTLGDVYMPQVEEFVKAMIFPFIRDGELINRKYRDAKKNFRMDKQAERIFFNIDSVSDITIIVEGEMDCLSLLTVGYRAAISVPDGAPAPDAKNYSSKFEFLESCAAQLERVKTFILAVDNDAPGKVLEDELSRRLGRDKCLRVEWPAGCKDANEVLMKHGAAILKNCIETAKQYPIEGVFSVAGQADKIFRLYSDGLERGVSTGWESLDKFYTCRPGELDIVTGIPNSGKSELIDALVVNLAKLHGWGVAICSPENQPMEDHIARLIEKFVKKPFNNGITPRMTEDELTLAIGWADKHFYMIYPGDVITLDKVLAAAEKLVFRHGIKGLVLDPWNEFEHQFGEKSETNYIGDKLTFIRRWARRNGVKVWIVVHPAKLMRGKDGNYPVPTLYDCSSSANWRNKADNGLSIWRDFKRKDGEIEVHVQKIRFRQIGKVGVVPLRYMKVTGTYEQAEEGEEREAGDHEPVRGNVYEMPGMTSANDYASIRE